VALVEDGRSLTVDVERIARWGGVDSLRRRLESEMNGDVDGGVIEDFSGMLFFIQYQPTSTNVKDTRPIQVPHTCYYPIYR
jgi:hypothetical protein